MNKVTEWARVNCASFSQSFGNINVSEAGLLRLIDERDQLKQQLARWHSEFGDDINAATAEFDEQFKAFTEQEMTAQERVKQLEQQLAQAQTVNDKQTQLNAELEAKLAQAQAECAATSKAFAKMNDSITVPNDASYHNTVPSHYRVRRDDYAALAECCEEIDCGKGWLSPDEAKSLKEQMRVSDEAFNFHLRRANELMEENNRLKELLGRIDT